MTTRQRVHLPSPYCTLGTADHWHEATFECLHAGHRLDRIDDLMSWQARFQHGPNPEHSLLVNLDEVEPDECLGKRVDGWVVRIHEREQLEEGAR